MRTHSSVYLDPIENKSQIVDNSEQYVWVLDHMAPMENKFGPANISGQYFYVPDLLDPMKNKPQAVDILEKYSCAASNNYSEKPTFVQFLQLPYVHRLLLFLLMAGG